MSEFNTGAFLKAFLGGGRYCTSNSPTITYCQFPPEGSAEELGMLLRAELFVEEKRPYRKRNTVSENEL